MFSGDIERDQWHETGSIFQVFLYSNHVILNHEMLSLVFSRF